MNITKYYLYRIFEELMPIYPLYVLMFENKGLTVAQISILLAIWSVPSIILEIPTGILADRWSRRNLLILGGLLRALCYFTWIISGNFIGYAVGFIFWGIGGALRSGSEEALLYDSLKIQGKEMQFDLVYGRGHFLSGISTILASVAGGFIGMQYGFRMALGLSVVSGLVTAGIAFSMKEVNLYKEQLEEVKHSGGKDTLRKALSFLLSNKAILLFSLLTLLVITTAGVLDEYDQLIAKEYGLSISLIGIWTAVRFIMIAFGGFAARGLRIAVEKLFHLKDRMYSISLLCLISAGFLVAAGLIRHMGIMILYGLYYLIMSAGEVLQEDYVQQKIELEGRSTIHSLIALTRNLYGILCYGLFGFTVVMTDLIKSLVWCGAYIALWTAVIVIIYKAFKVNNKRRWTDDQEV